MHRTFLFLAVAGCVQAGTIQGIVLEHASGRPLARSIVRLDPVPQSSGSKVEPLSMRVGLSGTFVFPSVRPGVYLLTSIHDGYFPASFGQRLPVGHGAPIEVTNDSTVFAELRMRHKGAVTGRILDENGVGTAGIPVVAYRARLPLRSAGTAVSGDRGVFRIAGLEAGKYWVRSASYTLVDGTGWLPTFGLVARDVREARVYPVVLDADSTDADISPETGPLFQISGTITCQVPGPLIVTLSSETTRRSVQTECPPLTYSTEYRFESLAPAVYEIFAALRDGTASGFTELYLDHDLKSVNVQISQAPPVEFEVRRVGSNAPYDIPLTLLGHRQDLAETEPEREIAVPRAALGAGHWEMRARVPSDHYVESIVSQRAFMRRPGKIDRPADWFDVYVDPRIPTRIRITLSDKAGHITGKVLVDGKPAVGAPVFVWPLAESARRSLNGPAQTLSDTDGQFRFDGLPPGDYRVLASFDVNELDEDWIELSHAPTVHVDASQSASVELALWVAPL